MLKLINVATSLYVVIFKWNLVLTGFCVVNTPLHVWLTKKPELWRAQINLSWLQHISRI